MMFSMRKCSSKIYTITVLSLIILINNWNILVDGSEYTALWVNENCDLKGVLFYEDIGCTPRYEQGKWCPISYDCHNLTRLSNSCRLRGKVYNAGQEADGIIQEHACRKSCICRQRPHAPAEFLCGSGNCPDWDGIPKLRSGCHRKYELHRCCAAGVICDENIPMCEYDGKSFMDGERVYLNDYCNKCICNNGFRVGKAVNFNHCTRMKCGVELEHPEKIEQYCAPAYIASPNDKLCCPNFFICPSINDIIINGQDSKKGICNFGDNVYNLGATFNRSMGVFQIPRTFRCDCKLPPFFTCWEVA